ncbi:hypothetical protein Dimus_018538 [Dionaea muscipula]
MLAWWGAVAHCPWQPAVLLSISRCCLPRSSAARAGVASCNGAASRSQDVRQGAAHRQGDARQGGLAVWIDARMVGSRCSLPMAARGAAGHKPVLPAAQLSCPRMAGGNGAVARCRTCCCSQILGELLPARGLLVLHGRLDDVLAGWKKLPAKCCIGRRCSLHEVLPAS